MTKGAEVPARDERTPEPEVPPAARRRAIGWATGVPHALGAALLVASEAVRGDLGDLGGPPPARPPSYAEDFARLHDTLAEHLWFRAAEWLRDGGWWDEPRLLLWAAVFAALVVRLNRDGPPRVQLALSVAAAVYCVPAAAAGIPYFALAEGYALPFLLTCGAVAVAAATRPARRRTPVRPGARHTNGGG
ncbi:hypothetical protein [Streptomyces sp. HNM0574]|uniref:hypothetical protein n=1 Tax=Streptomyces sp. HNM0574 TaxID=2714954 RepID=UPI00146EECF1|nr:hypothetical protein [Streptomyces sp. HNM0574]NLU66635.1 hypothetical protein [Streptomyces sp. HNM0574]